MVKKIHFILPAGGVRGAFQAGFLYGLFTNYKDSFEIARIDGTSVGALNGFAIINHKYDYLKNLWYSLNTINDLFSNWTESYFLGSLQNYYKGFYNSGMLSNSKIAGLLKNDFNEWDNYDKNYKDKYSCVCVNLDNAKSEYILGSNNNIREYVKASASPWIVTCPTEIDNIKYTDGALLEAYPLKYINKCNADLTVIVGYDQEHLKYKSYKSDDLLNYLANLIDIARFNSLNTLRLQELIKNTDQNKIISIANPMKILINDFNKENIIEGFSEGVEFADTFYNTYIKK